MKPIRDAWCALIDVTYHCNRECSYCTRNDRHLGRLKYHMSLPQIEQALESYQGFNGQIGIIGGEPLAHPQFKEICAIARKHFPKEKLALFTSLQVPKYEADMRLTFGNIQYHPHTPEQESKYLHQPLTIACRDAVEDKDLRSALIDDCWLQRKWCPTITDDGAFFCEVGASIAKMQGVNGYPVVKGWWQREPSNFDSQLNLCQLCGMCIPMERQPMKDKKEKISPSFLRLLQDKQLPVGEYELFDRKISAAEMKAAQPKWTPGWYKAEQFSEKFTFSNLDFNRWIKPVMAATPIATVNRSVAAPVVHVYALCYNEQDIIPFFTEYYSRFAEKLIIYDNCSTDASVSRLKACQRVEVRSFESSRAREDIQRQIRNTAWKESKGKADWVVVCDMDEFVWHPDLVKFLSNAPQNITAYNLESVEMVSDKFPVYGQGLITEQIRTGKHFNHLPLYKFIECSKMLLFRPDAVTETNYSDGSHCNKAVMTGRMVVDNSIKFLHYRYLGLDYVLRKISLLRDRLSPENKANRWCTHWNKTTADITSDFNELKRLSELIIKNEILRIESRKICLPRLQLICIAGKNAEDGQRALLHSMRGIEFWENKGKLLSCNKPANLDPRIEYCYIPQWQQGNTIPLSEFCVYYAAFYMDTEQALFIHPDGFVINPHLWQNRFLDYDFIGAPWTPRVLLPKPQDAKMVRTSIYERVGNGGFSIRTKRFMKQMQKYSDLWNTKYSWNLSEDYWSIFTMTRDDLTIAPLELAMNFSTECIIPEYPDWHPRRSFGFHGKFYPELCSLAKENPPTTKQALERTIPYR